MRPNGLAHLPPVLARQPPHPSTIHCKAPLRIHAEGGQVEPVLGVSCPQKALAKN
jgi:hypothetical protein